MSRYIFSLNVHFPPEVPQPLAQFLISAPSLWTRTFLQIQSSFTQPTIIIQETDLLFIVLALGPTAKGHPYLLDTSPVHSPK